MLLDKQFLMVFPFLAGTYAFHSDGLESFKSLVQDAHTALVSSAAFQDVFDA